MEQTNKRKELKQRYRRVATEEDALRLIDELMRADEPNVVFVTNRCSELNQRLRDLVAYYAKCDIRHNTGGHYVMAKNGNVIYFPTWSLGKYDTHNVSHIVDYYPMFLQREHKEEHGSCF